MRTDPEKLEVSKKVCKDYSLGGVTLQSCCLKHGVRYRTFLQWKKESFELSDEGKKKRPVYAQIAANYSRAKKDATKAFRTGLKDLARNSLERLVAGFEYEEVHKTYKGRKLESTKRVKRQTAPNVTAVIFAITNMDPANFKHIADLRNKGSIDMDQVNKIRLKDGTEITV